MATNVRLPDGFWDDFVAKQWEREPTVFRGLFPQPFVPADEMFQTLLRAVGHAASLDVRLFVDNKQVSRPYELVMCAPSPSDESLEGFVQRLDRQLEGRRFGWVINGLPAHDEPLWGRLREFFSGLVERVGLPASMVECALFLGNYDSTPFGIHRDAGNLFTFSIGAHKKMHLWPEGFFESRGVPRIASTLLAPPEPFLDEATTLEMGPHDLMYWPSSMWHVGGESGKFAATLACGFYRDNMQRTPDEERPLAMGVGAALGVAAQSHPALTRFAYPSAGVPAGMVAVPAEVEAPIAALREVAASETFRRRLVAEWLRRATSSGVVAVPPPDPPDETVGRATALTLRSGAKLCYARVPPDKIVVSANGHDWDVLDDAASVALLDGWTSGRALAIETVLGAASTGRADLEASLIELVRFLGCARALARVDAAPR